MQFYPHRTVEEQANRLPRELREAYRNSQIDRIRIISGAVAIDVTGYAEYSYLEEKSYMTQPVRTIDGKIEDLEEYATFLTPRLIIKYNMMNIDDYRSLMKLLKERNSLWVELYDVVEDKIVTKEMYAAPTSMPIIYQQYLIALGIQEFSIELIGTNNDDDFKFYIDNWKYITKIASKWSDVVAKEIEWLTVSSSGYVVERGSPDTHVFGENGVPVLGDHYVIPNHQYYVDVY